MLAERCPLRRGCAGATGTWVADGLSLRRRSRLLQPPAWPFNVDREKPMSKTTKQPVSTLSDIVAGVQKQFGQESIRLLDGEMERAADAISSGCLALDRALGIGGYPRGRIVEIYGPESSGKTTLTLHAIAEAQEAGGICAFVDAEHAFDPAYARATGVRTAELLLAQPDSGEQALDIVDSLASCKKLALIVIDSVAALVPQAEIDGSMTDNPIGLQARLMSRALRKLTAVASKTNTTLLFVNQLRNKIGVTFGSPETTPGGNALKYYSSLRLDVRRIGKVTADEKMVGSRTRVRVVKNKCAQPFEEAEFDIRWGSGIDIAADLLDTALAAGTVTRNGSHYVYQSKAIGQGRERARASLLESAELRGALLEETMGLLWSGAPLPGLRSAPLPEDALAEAEKSAA
jgi:recombination protein RecA